MARAGVRVFCILAPEVPAMDRLLDRITIDPDVCHGKPCLRGMRYPVEWALDLMSGGMSEAELLEDYPDLESDDIRAALAYAARMARTHRTTALAA
ncbi:MAG: hypothetical protein Rubg2KO_24950 [Rubricoccaceae bacterium]